MANPFIERARMLISQSRYDLAEKEARMALVKEPNNSDGHCVLALSLLGREQFREATEAAQTAIELAPDNSFPYYVLARILLQRNHFEESEQAIRAAIEIDPFQPGYFALLASTYMSREKAREALDAADHGLSIDPENSDCANIRALALVKLGKKDDATGTIRETLAHDPGNAVTHASMGWAMLTKHKPKEALPHFQEALRIDPTLEMARQGVVESLKARYFLYRFVLAFFLWMMRLDGQKRWMILIGGYLGYTVLRRVAAANPDVAPFLMPFIIAYIAFAILTWVASPLFDLLLRLNRYGRMVLSREQIITSNFVGICVAMALISLILYFVLGDSEFLPVALMFGLMIPPISTIYVCDPGWPRTINILIAAGLGGLGLLSSGLLIAARYVQGEAGELMSGIGFLLLIPFFLGAFVSQFVVQALAQSTVRK